MENDKLDFGFMQHEDILEAIIPDGFVHISENCREFSVRVYYKGESIYIGTNHSIYDALDAANEWWLSAKNGS